MRKVNYLTFIDMTNKCVTATTHVLERFEPKNSCSVPVYTIWSNLTAYQNSANGERKVDYRQFKTSNIRTLMLSINVHTRLVNVRRLSTVGNIPVILLAEPQWSLAN